MNYIYNELINPISNMLIYFFYILGALILMPILYVDNKGGAIVAAVIAYILLLVILIITRVIERSVKKNIEKNRGWTKYFNKFSNDTSALGYILTSLGYLMVILDTGAFWYIYGNDISIFFCNLF